MQVSPKQLMVFRDALTRNGLTAHALPTNVELNRVYAFEGYFNGSRGYQGLWFFVKEDDGKNLFMDYYFQNDDIDGHYRIDEAGNTIRLENMITQWSARIRSGNPVEDENERAREIEHNKKVYAILKSKGFRND